MFTVPVLDIKSDPLDALLAVVGYRLSMLADSDNEDVKALFADRQVTIEFASTESDIARTFSFDNGQFSQQSGHAKEDYAIVEKMLCHDYNLKPVKPVMDSEPRYENIPKKFKKENGVFSAADSREIMYQSLLSGACGHTYGCNEIWQMYSPGFSPVIDAFVPWKEALDFKGAQAVFFARELFGSIDFTTIQPAPSLLLSGNTDYKDMAVAATGKDFALVYLPNGNPVLVNLEKAFQTASVKMCWFNPRNGEYSNSWNEKVSAKLKVQPPVSGDGTDWLLMIKKQ